MKKQIIFGGICTTIAILVGVNAYAKRTAIGTFTIPAPIKGDRGDVGPSAYDTWLEMGNNGDKNDFLASLQGKDGNDGAAGKDGKDGNDGAAGKDGKDGKDGSNGCSPKIENGVPDQDTGCYTVTTTNYKLDDNGVCVADGGPTQNTAGCNGKDGKDACQKLSLELRSGTTDTYDLVCKDGE